MIKTESYTSQTEKIMEYNTKIRVNEEDYDLKIFGTQNVHTFSPINS